MHKQVVKHFTHFFFFRQLSFKTLHTDITSTEGDEGEGDEEEDQEKRRRRGGGGGGGGEEGER